MRISILLLVFLETFYKQPIQFHLQMHELTLDTNCFSRNSEELLKQLKKLENLGKIRVWRELYSDIETEEWINKDLDEIRDQMHNYSRVMGGAICLPMEISEDSVASLKYVEEKRGYTTEDLHSIHLKIDKKLDSTRESGERVKVREFREVKDEVSFLAREIKQILAVIRW